MQHFVAREVGPFEVRLDPTTALDLGHREHARLRIAPIGRGLPLDPDQIAAAAGIFARYLAKKGERVRQLATISPGMGYVGCGMQVDARGGYVDIDPSDAEALVAELAKATTTGRKES